MLKPGEQLGEDFTGQILNGEGLKRQLSDEEYSNYQTKENTKTKKAYGGGQFRESETFILARAGISRSKL